MSNGVPDWYKQYRDNHDNHKDSGYVEQLDELRTLKNSRDKYIKADAFCRPIENREKYTRVICAILCIVLIVLISLKILPIWTVVFPIVAALLVLFPSGPFHGEYSTYGTNDRIRMTYKDDKIQLDKLENKFNFKVE